MCREQDGRITRILTSRAGKRTSQEEGQAGAKGRILS